MRIVFASLAAAVPAVFFQPPQPPPQHFDANAAWALVRAQVALGPRPAGSRASRALADRLRRALPHGRFERVPGGLRNVIGYVPGRDPRRLVVVGAHYDTKDIRGFVGADDGASGTAVVVTLARALRGRELRPTVVFALFDGEESPPGAPETRFVERGLRGSRVAARRYRNAQAMILLDMIGDRNLSIRRDASASAQLWQRVRAAARVEHALAYFPAAPIPVVWDDHTPFERQGVPAVDLIDFTFRCWHRRCDDLRAVSRHSLDVVGRTVLRLLRGF